MAMVMAQVVDKVKYDLVSPDNSLISLCNQINLVKKVLVQVVPAVEQDQA
jgi:hypothetical protein